MAVLTGKTAIVTGASSGIGRATALLFAEEGASLVLVARRKTELDTLVAEIEKTGAKAVAVVGDVREESTAKAAVAAAEKHFGGLDIAFNNAGAVGEMKPIAELSVEGWQEALAINLTSAFFGAKYQVRALQKRGGGSLIFTSTFVGHTAGMPGMGAYAASKAGLIGLVQVLAAELGAQNIRANAILPGGTDTAALTASNAEQRAFIENLHALKRIARPEEIARSVLHLASDASSFVTGTAFLVDGGVSISRT